MARQADPREPVRRPRADSVAVGSDDRTQAFDVTESRRIEDVELGRFFPQPFGLVAVAAVERLQDRGEVSHRRAV